MDPRAVLMSITVLPALSGSAEPDDFVGVVSSLRIGGIDLDRTGLDNCDCDGGGVDSSAPLCWRYALNAVPSGFRSERFETTPL